MPSGIIQFQLLAEIEQALSEAGISYWLRGGWAIDFLLKQQTRPHSDIDLIVWRADAARLQDALIEADFQFVRDIGVQLDFAKQGEEIAVVFVNHLEGEIVVEGIPAWKWRSDALAYPPQSWRGLTCRVVSPAQLLDEKTTYEAGTGRPLRPKDRQSLIFLRQIIAQSGLNLS